MTALNYIVEGMRYIFLDRDGVLNRRPPEGGYVTNWSDFAWLPGSIGAIRRMNGAGFTLLVVTNQRGVALGLYSEEELAQIHRNMRADLARQGAHIDAIYHCPHDRGVCDCRKPGTGMFEQARRDFPGITAANSVMIGDSFTDIEAGKAFGMKTIFIGDEESGADFQAGSLEEAVDLIVA